MHHHTEIFSSLFSLLLSCLSSSVFSSLSVFFLCLYLCAVVVVVCDTLETPVYASTTRTCVFNMCAWCRHARGRFECIHGGGRRGEGKGVVVSLVFFIGKTSVY